MGFWSKLFGVKPKQEEQGQGAPAAPEQPNMETPAPAAPEVNTSDMSEPQGEANEVKTE